MRLSFSVDSGPAFKSCCVSTISSHETNAPYFNMGGYFLTGSGIQAVPEPASMLALALGATALLRRRKK